MTVFVEDAYYHSGRRDGDIDDRTVEHGESVRAPSQLAAVRVRGNVRTVRQNQ